MTNSFYACVEYTVIATFPTREAALTWLREQDDELDVVIDEDLFYFSKANIAIMSEADYAEVYGAKQ